MADNPLLGPAAAVRRNVLLDAWDAGKAALAEAWHGPQSPITGGPMYDPRAVPAPTSGAEGIGQVLGEYLDPATRGVGVNTVLGFTESPAAIKAYHGSPHSFDRFSMDKIGTGEGAQVYGHGLYFAGEEATARSYRDALAPVDPAKVRFAATRPDWMSEERFAAAQDELRQQLVEQRRRGGSGWPSGRVLGNDAGSLVSGGYVSGLRMPKSPGHMYEVSLQTEPNRLLDWDKPLSQQPAVASRLPADLLQRMEEHGQRSKSDWGDLGVGTDASSYATGQNLYHHLAGEGRDGAAAADALRRAGIDGIQYLDQGSRAAGEGSRNYVMFDDATIQLLRKYGLLPLATGGTAAAVTTDQ